MVMVGAAHKGKTTLLISLLLNEKTKSGGQPSHSWSEHQENLMDVSLEENLLKLLCGVAVWYGGSDYQCTRTDLYLQWGEWTSV